MDPADDCAICWEPLAATRCVTLTCEHVFHAECIQNMVAHHSWYEPTLKCPYCRSAFLPPRAAWHGITEDVTIDMIFQCIGIFFVLGFCILLWFCHLYFHAILCMFSLFAWAADRIPPKAALVDDTFPVAERPFIARPEPPRAAPPPGPRMRRAVVVQ